jgi:hypothetical protein
LAEGKVSQVSEKKGVHMPDSNINSVIAVVAAKDQVKAVSWYKMLFGRSGFLPRMLGFK